MSVAYTVLVLTVYALAVARITRLINADTITDWLRLIPARRMVAAQEAAQEAEALGQTKQKDIYRTTARRWGGVLGFLECPWCVGMWAALLTVWVPMWHHDNAVARYLALTLAVSHLIGVFARFADTEEIEIAPDDTDNDTR